jgi:hypothetical protein
MSRSVNVRTCRAIPRHAHITARTTLNAEGRLRGHPDLPLDSSVIVVSHLSLPQRLMASAAYTPVEADGVF